MSKPCVFFVSSCDLSPTNVIEKVFNEPLPDGETIDENITAYPWRIDNKYYTTEVHLCSVQSKAISTADVADSVDAIVLCFDPTNLTGLESAETWLPFLDVYDADIKILVCTSCDEDIPERINKRTALEWCVQRGFELVELEPNLEDVDPDDDFPETVGVERIRQALNAHQWSNLVLKSDNGLPGGVCEGNGFVESLEDLLEGDTFGDLFSQLAEMKARVATLSGNDRKDAAEQVVRAFWNAMGGEDFDEL